MSHCTGKQLTRLEEANGKQVEFATREYPDEIMFKFKDGTFLYGEIIDDAISFNDDIDLRKAVLYQVASPEGIQEWQERVDRLMVSAVSRREAEERITYERLKDKFEGDQAS